MISENRIRQIIKESIRSALSESVDTRKLYHCVDPVGRRPLAKNIGSVVNNGLYIHDNGERGNCIWFNVGKPFYRDFRGMIVSIMATPENMERFKMTDDYSQMAAKKSIPFDCLTIEQIPFYTVNGFPHLSIKSLRKNEDFISLLNRIDFRDIVVFKDVVDRFSGQIVDWNKLTNPNVKLINIL